VTWIGDAVLLAGAGVLAGTVGTAGGISSLISYPALLLAGLAPLVASESNLVALVVTWPGAALASRTELAGQAPRLRRWIPLAGAGGAAGAALLLCTPPVAFGQIVPVLVATGSLTLLAQPWLAARLSRAPDAASAAQRRFAAPAALTVLAAYNGYFGAGSGVMLLALLMVTGLPDLPTANAVKNMLLGAATLIPAAIFAVLEPVAWTATASLGMGLIAGSVLGPALTRRAPASLIRWVVAMAGLGLAGRLWWHPGT
jgi:uncharacterized membrane protein YfcA